MGQLADDLARVVDALRGAGLRASTDARDLSKYPAAWVTVHDIDQPVLCGSFETRADVCLIASDNGSKQSLAALSDLLDAALEVLTLEEPARPRMIQPPGIGAPLPALVITTAT